MADEEKSDVETKQSFRRTMRQSMNEKDYVNNPMYNRRGPTIPNFKGALEAAKRLGELEEFKRAKIIKLNPDKPQEPVKLMALEAGKEIVIPIPRLTTGLLHVTPPEDKEGVDIKSFTSRRELAKHGKPLVVDAGIKVDLVVMGAVCVSRLGHRIGKGQGFADLEFAIMMRMGAVDENTVVVTTVHDCQVVDELPVRLFEKHDVPVDIIITPTQTIYVTERLRKPEGIFWDLLTMRRIKSIRILQQLKGLDEKEGKIVSLQPDEAKKIPKRVRFARNAPRKMQDKRRSKSPIEDNRGNPDKEQSDQKNRENEEGKSLPVRKRRAMPKNIEKPDSPENESNDKPEKTQRRKPGNYRFKTNIDFSLKLSNIGSDVRIRDLKDALIERGVRPTDITWRGHRGFCYLHFGKLRNENSRPNQPVQVDSIVANLQQLRIGGVAKDADGEYIIVEPAKPITRIEITDVTAV
ncbi:uncharacterized protein Lost [Diachasmimorpha longicaudata]|uniref:uncharacterized protein Lost n=1 Tax=Diachasmimorpha longicaudata TaxID=58733 RepID=UPI0030B882FF